MLPIEPAFKVFTDRNGKPLENGYVYFGQPNLNPITSPVTVYWDAAGTQPAAQPLRTVNGYIMRSGTPANVFFTGSYSELVQDSKKRQVFYARNSDDFSIVTVIMNFIASLILGTGAALIGWIRNSAGAVATTLAKWLERQPVSLFDFMTDAQIADAQAGTHTLNMNGPLAAFAAAVATSRKKQGVVPPCSIMYTVSPNWAVDNSEIVFQGEVRLRYTGVGNAVIIDGGAVSGGVFNMKFGACNKPIIEGVAGSQNGVYARSILQGCHIGAQVVGCGTTYAGLRVEFAVTAKFDIVVSANVNGYVWFSKPANGIFLTQRGAGELCSYCTFNTPILEGTSGTGAYLDWAFGNNFFGGTMEGIESVGTLLTVNAFINNYYGVDFEVNTDHDIYCLGRENNFFFCSTNKVITFDAAAKNNNVIGGSHQDINLTAATFGNVIQALTYNRNGGGLGIVDATNGANPQRDVRNAYVTTLAPTTSGITVGPSPFTFTNSTKQADSVAIVGGNISSIVLTHGGLATAGLATTQIFDLSPGDALTVSYTVAPSMNLLTR